MSETARRRYLRRWEALKMERSTWVETWREVSDQVRPRRGRFLGNGYRNKPQRNEKILNSTPTKASHILASGMMAGITSPARPWFRLTLPDADLAQQAEVARWLYEVERRVQTVFARSNLYNALHQLYLDLVTFCTSAMHIDDDVDDVVRAYVYPIGSYALSTSPRQAVDTVYREMSMTTRQLADRFGLDRVSSVVRDMVKRGDLDTWIDVLHVVEPRRDYDPEMIGNNGKPIRSCWMEVAGRDDDELLGESGYYEMPVLCPRWDVTGEDVYGQGPGLESLGDCKQLQFLERRKAQIVDKITSPPMVGPSSLMHRRLSTQPGDWIFADSMTSGQKVEPAIVINPQALVAVSDMIGTTERRIESAFFADLWLMLIQGSQREMTAREVAERHEEKMLQLGPVLERLQDELLDPLIDRVFSIMVRRGALPRAPEALQGMELRVEYVSIISQAQKLIHATGLERFSGFVAGLAGVDPTVLDKVNHDEVVQEYALSLGVPPTVTRSAEEVQAMRAERAERQQAAEQGQAMLAATEGAKNLAQATLSDENALTRMASSLGAPVPAGTA